MLEEPIKSNQLATILKLSSKFKCLDNLDKIPEDYSEPIKVRQDISNKIDYSKEEYRNIYTWNKDLERFKLNKNVEFEVWSANIEHRKNNIYSDSDKKSLLAKADRTGIYGPIPVIFYCKSNIVYCIIVTSNDICLDKIKLLINNSNIDLTINPLTTTENVIDWLFWRKMTNKNVLSSTDGNPDIKLQGIFGFEGSVLKNDADNTLTGRSPQVSNLDVTKAALCFNSELTSAKIELNYYELDITFFYSTNGNVIIDARRSNIDSQVCEYKNGQAALHSCQVIVYLCSIIIPDIFDKFNKDSQVFLKEFGGFKQTLAKYLIDKLTKLYPLDT